jgi:ATP-binding cassette subfamily B protein
MKKQVRRSFLRQQGQSDCGVACLASIIRYYGGSASLERLRELSGTTPQGTTLLGLYQAAQQLGLEAVGWEADMESLKQIRRPVILHVILDNRLSHYLVCYHFDGCHFYVGDPAQGLLTYREAELSAIWQSRTLLEMQPTSDFVGQSEQTQQKKSWLIALTNSLKNYCTCPNLFLTAARPER